MKPHMPLFEATQATLIATLNTGPDALDPALFAGPPERVLLGLKAHANTISHARLVALEASFPLTRKTLGDAAFNALSRLYVETAPAQALDSNRIGRQFATYLRSTDMEPSICELALIEWAYLKSYHAPEAEALCLADLSALSESGLLETTIALHPSAQVIILSAPLHPALRDVAESQKYSHLESIPVTEATSALLLVRPQAEVLLHPITLLQQALLTAAEQKNVTLGNVLAITIEQGNEAAPLDAVSHLIDVGALITTG